MRKVLKQGDSRVQASSPKPAPDGTESRSQLASGAKKVPIQSRSRGKKKRVQEQRGKHAD